MKSGIAIINTEGFINLLRKEFDFYCQDHNIHISGPEENNENTKHFHVNNWITSVYSKYAAKKICERWIENNDLDGVKKTSVKNSDPEWVRNLENALIVDRLPESIKSFLYKVFNYVYFEEYTIADAKTLKAMPVEMLEKKVEQWERILEKRAELEKKEIAKQTNAIVCKENIIHTFKDGCYVIWLKTTEDTKREGAVMGHCIGSYDPEKSSVSHVSFRTPNGVSFATADISPKISLTSGSVKDFKNRSVSQLKGVRNQMVAEKYRPLISEFLKMMELQSVTIEFKLCHYLLDEILEFFDRVKKNPRYMDTLDCAITCLNYRNAIEYGLENALRRGGDAEKYMEKENKKYDVEAIKKEVNQVFETMCPLIVELAEREGNKQLKESNKLLPSTFEVLKIWGRYDTQRFNTFFQAVSDLNPTFMDQMVEYGKTKFEALLAE